VQLARRQGYTGEDLQQMIAEHGVGSARVGRGPTTTDGLSRGCPVTDLWLGSTRGG
jgi:hypothetical protein